MAASQQPPRAAGPVESAFRLAAAPAPSKEMAHRLEDALKGVFKHDAFRGVQQQAIWHTLAGTNALVVMPTGGGKSLCYSLPATILPGVCIVISPLIALINDQVAALRTKGVQAAAFTSATSAANRTALLNDLRRSSPSTKLLFVAPEGLSQNQQLARILEQLARRGQVSLLAVDEAHCVVQWGFDFRPGYLKVAEFRSRCLAGVPCLALTATAAPAMRKEIARCLELNAGGSGRCRPALLLAGFNRPNIVLSVRLKDVLLDPMEDLLAFVLNRRSSCGIIYARTREACTELKAKLQQRGVSAEEYHAGMTTKKRAAAQKAWMEGRAMVMVATVAFGMGIDKRDVRYVVHWAIPTTIEALYQESGRAGRDGRPSESVVYHQLSDVRLQAFLIRKGAEDPPAKSAASTSTSANFSGKMSSKSKKSGKGKDAPREASSFFTPRSAMVVGGEPVPPGWSAAQVLGGGTPAEEAAARAAEQARHERQVEGALLALQSVIDYCEAIGCRRQKLLSHFADPEARAGGGTSGKAICCDWCRDSEAVREDLKELDARRRDASTSWGSKGRSAEDAEAAEFAAQAAALLGDNGADDEDDSGSDISDPFGDDASGERGQPDGSSLQGKMGEGRDEEWWDRLEAMEEDAGAAAGSSGKLRGRGGGGSSSGAGAGAGAGKRQGGMAVPAGARSSIKFETAAAMQRRAPAAASASSASSGKAGFKRPRSSASASNGGGGSGGDGGGGAAAAAKRPAFVTAAQMAAKEEKKGGADGGTGGSSSRDASMAATFFNLKARPTAGATGKPAAGGPAAATSSGSGNGGSGAKRSAADFFKAKPGGGKGAASTGTVQAATSATEAAADGSAAVAFTAPPIGSLRARNEDATSKNLGLTVPERRRGIAAMIKLLRQHRGLSEEAAIEKAVAMEWSCFYRSNNTAVYRTARTGKLGECKATAA